MLKFLAKLINWESVRGRDNTAAKRFTEAQKVERMLASDRQKDALRLRQEELRRQREGAEIKKGDQVTSPNDELRM